MVHGLFTAETPDLDKEVCDYEKTKPYYKALVDKFLKATSAVDGMATSMFPVREMHQLKAVGCGKGIEFDDTEKTISGTVHVVDPAAVKKVQAGVLIGFSQGGGYVGDPIPDPVYKGCVRYVADPGEMSLVDSPCLPQALIDGIKEKTYQYRKADGSVELRKFAMPATSQTAPTVLAPDKTSAKRVLTLKAEQVDKLKKGMYTVAEFARLVDNLRWMQDSVTYERDSEGDDSAVPETMGELLREAVACFMEMADEESQELLAGLAKIGANTMTPEEIKALETKVTKALETVSKAKASMKSLHDHLGKGMQMCKDLMGADEETDDAKKAKDAADLLKAQTDEAARVAAAAAGTGMGTGAPVAKAYTEAEIEAKIAEGIAKAKAAEQANLVKGTLVARPGEQILNKADETQDINSLAPVY